jgi:putative nucleotidyltransferase with HDIG domain
VPAIVLAVVVLWVLETGWVAAAVALERGGKVWRRLRASLGPMLALDGALASVGLLLALLYQNGWQLLGETTAGEPGYQGALLLAGVTLIPSGVLYYAYRLQGHLRQVYAESLQTLGALMEAKVEGGQPGHGERVAALAAAMAQALELPAGEVEQVRYAGYLHDIGKVGVPAELLQRGRSSFTGEAAPVRLHPHLGAQILAPIHFLGPAAEMVQAHHERWDGLGYPVGRRGAAIPLGARLLSLADAYVSLTAEPGTPAGSAVALSTDHILALLRESAGSRYDPDLVATLGHVLKRAHGASMFSGREIDAPTPA